MAETDPAKKSLFQSVSSFDDFRTWLRGNKLTALGAHSGSSLARLVLSAVVATQTCQSAQLHHYLQQ